MGFVFVPLLLLALSVSAGAQDKYSGPRPQKPDIPYLLHASTLVETEAGEAMEEKTNDFAINYIAGAGSPVRTPLAEPIFLVAVEKLEVQKLQLYKLDVKGGRRQVAFPVSPKKQRDAPQPVRLSLVRLDPGLFRVEASETLANGEYCLSPAGSNRVFCFQVY